MAKSVCPSNCATKTSTSASISEVESVDRLRRVSYLRATKEDRIQSDSDQDESEQVRTDLDGSKQVQQVGIQKIFSVFGKKSSSSSDNFPSPLTSEASKTDDFLTSSEPPTSEVPLKEGWLEFQSTDEEAKVNAYQCDLMA